MFFVYYVQSTGFYTFTFSIKIHSLIIKFDGLEIEGALLRPSTGNRILGWKIEFMYDFFISCDIYHLTLILIVYIYVYVYIYIYIVKLFDYVGQRNI